MVETIETEYHTWHAREYVNNMPIVVESNTEVNALKQLIEKIKEIKEIKCKP